MPDDEWERSVRAARSLCESESSVRTLGEVLRADEALEVPVPIIIAVYRRLFDLRVCDVRTRVCFARYLLLHGPEWDDEAASVLSEVEETARAARLWDEPHLGHHPVFFSG